MRSIRVLIVDDETEFVTALVERLNLRGMQADGMSDGEAAIKAIQTTPYDVVVLDVKMPGLGGLQIIRRIKQARPNLQVVLLTGRSSPQDEDLGKSLGCYEYLIKPVSISNLIDILKGAAQKSKELQP